jgi:hypothetical protein
VLIPGGQQLFAVQSQVPDNIAKLVSREACIHNDRQIMKPEFGFSAAGTDMHWAGSSPSFE